MNTPREGATDGFFQPPATWGRGRAGAPDGTLRGDLCIRILDGREFGHEKDRGKETFMDRCSTGPLLPIQPCIQVGGAKTPHFSYVGAVDLSTSCQLLQGFVMNV